jgi:hypothetical protein
MSSSHAIKATPAAILVQSAVLAVSFLALQAVSLSAAPLAGASDPDAVVVRYQEVIGELAEADRGPSLEVYADGRVRVHFPAYMRRAGDWETTLDAPALDALIDSLVGHGVLTFDAAATRARKRQSLAARAVLARGRPGETLLFEVADETTTIITLRIGDTERTVSWSGLRGDSKHHPELSELGELRAAQRSLEALMTRPGLVRRPVSGATP